MPFLIDVESKMFHLHAVMETITISNEVEARVSLETNFCHSVKILTPGIVPFGPFEVNKYLDRGFTPRHAVAACIGWKESAGMQMDEDSQMLDQ